MEKERRMMRACIIMLAVSSFSLLLITVSDYSGNAFNVAMAILTGILFWLFLILGYVALGVVSSRRKRFEREHRTRRRANDKKKPGIICFFSNKYASIADAVMIVLLIILIVLVIIPADTAVPRLFVVPTLIFSVHMHCVLNGVNYRYIKRLSK